MNDTTLDNILDNSINSGDIFLLSEKLKLLSSNAGYNNAEERSATARWFGDLCGDSARLGGLLSLVEKDMIQRSISPDDSSDANSLCLTIYSSISDWASGPLAKPGYAPGDTLKTFRRKVIFGLFRRWLTRLIRHPEIENSKEKISCFFITQMSASLPADRIDTQYIVEIFSTLDNFSRKAKFKEVKDILTAIHLELFRRAVSGPADTIRSFDNLTDLEIDNQKKSLIGIREILLSSLEINSDLFITETSELFRNDKNFVCRNKRFAGKLFDSVWEKNNPRLTDSFIGICKNTQADVDETDRFDKALKEVADNTDGLKFERFIRAFEEVLRYVPEEKWWTSFFRWFESHPHLFLRTSSRWLTKFDKLRETDIPKCINQTRLLIQAFQSTRNQFSGLDQQRADALCIELRLRIFRDCAFAETDCWKEDFPFEWLGALGEDLFSDRLMSALIIGENFTGRVFSWIPPEKNCWPGIIHYMRDLPEKFSGRINSFWEAIFIWWKTSDNKSHVEECINIFVRQYLGSRFGTDNPLSFKKQKTAEELMASLGSISNFSDGGNFADIVRKVFPWAEGLNKRWKFFRKIMVIFLLLLIALTWGLSAFQTSNQAIPNIIKRLDKENKEAEKEGLPLLTTTFSSLNTGPGDDEFIEFKDQIIVPKSISLSGVAISHFDRSIDLNAPIKPEYKPFFFREGFGTINFNLCANPKLQDTASRESFPLYISGSKHRFVSDDKYFEFKIKKETVSKINYYSDGAVTVTVNLSGVLLFIEDEEALTGFSVPLDIPSDFTLASSDPEPSVFKINDMDKLRAETENERQTFLAKCKNLPRAIRDITRSRGVKDKVMEELKDFISSNTNVFHIQKGAPEYGEFFELPAGDGKKTDNITNISNGVRGIFSDSIILNESDFRDTKLLNGAPVSIARNTMVMILKTQSGREYVLWFELDKKKIENRILRNINIQAPGRLILGCASLLDQSFHPIIVRKRQIGDAEPTPVKPGTPAWVFKFRMVLAK